MSDAVPPFRRRSRPSARSSPKQAAALKADRGHDFDKYRRLRWKRGVEPTIARRGVAHGSGLGTVRWVVEGTFAWLHQFKRLRIRHECRAEPRQGPLELVCSTICLRRLRRSLRNDQCAS
ncbi:hypothetical protein GCM10010145_47000 [Streptomyces ruber]|uniref:Transposase IS4-like domain-containing protein n=2 Tax=Streptomyces TaxID=1883 RepID=A0A918BJV3_9ACTN|nr:hypothetical protein GCM10010145_47000 [Streptomyces ruber]